MEWLYHKLSLFQRPSIIQVIHKQNLSLIISDTLIKIFRRQFLKLQALVLDTKIKKAGIKLSIQNIISLIQNLDFETVNKLY